MAKAQIWERFNATQEKAESEKFRGFNVGPVGKFEQLPPIEVQEPMTRERALAILDKIRKFESHMELRPLFDQREEIEGFAEVDHGYTAALILRQWTEPRKIEVK